MSLPCSSSSCSVPDTKRIPQFVAKEQQQQRQQQTEVASSSSGGAEEQPESLSGGTFRVIKPITEHPAAPSLLLRLFSTSSFSMTTRTTTMRPTKRYSNHPQSPAPPPHAASSPPPSLSLHPSPSSDCFLPLFKI